jgi:hypothetical protein
MTKIAEYSVKVHSTKDKKKLKSGVKEYEYGTIIIRSPKLKNHIGTTVLLKIEDIDSKGKFRKNAKTP